MEIRFSEHRGNVRLSYSRLVLIVISGFPGAFFFRDIACCFMDPVQMASLLDSKRSEDSKEYF